MSGINLVVSTRFHRAAPKGCGNTKSITNYAPAFMAQRDAKAAGFNEALFLDSTDTNVEEVGGACVCVCALLKRRHLTTRAAANFFCLGQDGVIRTPGD